MSIRSFLSGFLLGGSLISVGSYCYFYSLGFFGKIKLAWWMWSAEIPGWERMFG